MIAVRKLHRGIGNVEVQEVADPIPGPGQVLVEVDSAGICGTDIHIYYDEFETWPPVTMGHEFAGTIVEVHKGVSSWMPGDRVTSSTYFFTCGSCRFCREGRPNLCPDRRSIGSKQDGAFAQYVVLPEKNLYRVPESLELENAAFTEPLACVVHALLQTSRVVAGDNVVVTGPGPIGLLALQLIKLSGAGAVLLGTSVDEDRLALGKALGADAVFDVQTVENLAQAVSDVFHGEADLVVECSGSARAAQTLLDLARRGARYCQIGLYGKPIPFDQDQICYKELSVTGTNAQVPSAWTRALKLLAEGSIDVSRLISHRFELARWSDALGILEQKRATKVILKPNR